MMLSPLMTGLLLVAGIAAFIYYDLRLARRYFRDKGGRNSDFLRWWLKKNATKFTIGGGVLVIVTLALCLQEYTLVLPKRLSWSALPKKAQWGMGTLLCLSAFVAFDLFMAWRFYLGEGQGEGTADVRFYRWWLRKSAVKFRVAGGLAVLTLGSAWTVNHYHLTRLSAETSGYMANAQQYYKQKKYREASLELRNAISRNRGDYEAYFWMGRVMWQLGALPEARDAYREVIRIEPKLYAAHLELCRLALVMRDPEAARGAADQALALAPNSPEPRLLLARAYNAGGKRDLALEQCRALITEEFAAPELRQEYIVLLQKLRAFSEILQVTESGMKKNPTDAALMQARAKALAGLGRLGEAEKVLRTAAGAAPASPEPCMGLGDLMVLQGKYLAALTEYEEALKRAPDHERAMNNIASINAEHGFDMERSAVLAARLLAKHPKDHVVADTLGWTLFRQGKPQQALPLLRQAVNGMPANPVHHYHLGVALIKSGETVAGRKELETALRITGTFDGAEHARALLKGNG